MKLILRYVKPFIPLVAIALILLFGQTILELYLPNYMSSIVNVGIVQSGITNAAPDVMDADMMDMTLRFLDGTEAASVKNAYTWVDAGKADAKTLKAYPGLASKGAYVRNAMDKETLAAVNTAVSKAYYILNMALGGADFASMGPENVAAAAATVSDSAVAAVP